MISTMFKSFFTMVISSFWKKAEVTKRILVVDEEYESWIGI